MNAKRDFFMPRILFYVICLSLCVATQQAMQKHTIQLRDALERIQLVTTQEPISLLTPDQLEQRKLARQKRKEILNQKKYARMLLSFAIPTKIVLQETQCVSNQELSSDPLPIFCEATQKYINPEYDTCGNLLVPLFDEPNVLIENPKLILKILLCGYRRTNGAYCKKMFIKKTDLERHRKRHTTAKEHLCTECNKVFTSTSYLKEHMNSHTGEKPYQCTYCKKSFSRSATLRNHMYIHTGEKPYTCTYCGKPFSQTSNLKAHIRTHTGEKPFVCTMCSKAFTQLAQLKRHHNYTHTNERPYPCDHCNKAFSDLYSLNRHKRTHEKKNAT